MCKKTPSPPNTLEHISAFYALYEKVMTEIEVEIDTERMDEKPIVPIPVQREDTDVPTPTQPTTDWKTLNSECQRTW